MKYFKHFDQEWQKLMFQNVMPELMVLLSVEQYDMERRQMVMMNGHRASRFEFINNFQIPEAFVNELFDFCEEIRTEKYCRSIIAILAALTLFSSDRGYPKELDNGKFQKIVRKKQTRTDPKTHLTLFINRYRNKSRITPDDGTRIPTVKLKIPGKFFLKSETRTSVSFKL